MKEIVRDGIWDLDGKQDYSGMWERRHGNFTDGGHRNAVRLFIVIRI